jgi:phage repressor protein C with HTH and peptisase S24 domain
MNHADIWRALDTLAAEKGLSASGLARRAGLDPTAFNPSKRVAADGRPRWPSTESLSRVLAAVGEDFSTFAGLVAGRRVIAGAMPRPDRRVPLIGLTQAGSAGYFDDGGYPVGGAWDEIALPEVADDPNAYALEISGQSMEPVYREGDHVVVSPAAPIRRGDRVVLRTVAGEVMAKQLVRRSAMRVEVKSLNPAFPDLSFPLDQVAWIHRIVWASQ